MTLIKKVASRPDASAPKRSISVFLVPVSKKAIAMPGSAECDIASPNKLCFLITAKLPSTPLMIPISAEPRATTWNV